MNIKEKNFGNLISRPLVNICNSPRQIARKEMTIEIKTLLLPIPEIKIETYSKVRKNLIITFNLIIFDFFVFKVS